RIHYRDQGNPEGVPIIFIHGTSSSLHTWEPLAERLGDAYRIISYDHPGNGLTGPAPNDDYSAHGRMKALNSVAAAAGVDTFILAGNSMGGWVSWRYALENPDRVEALILLDAAGAPLLEGEYPPPLNLGFRLMKIKWLRPLLEQVTPRSIVERSVYDTVTVDSIVTDGMVDRYWELLRYPGNRRAAALRTDVDRETAMFDRIPEITAPTFVIWGAEDQLIYVSAAQTFHDRLPNSDIFILNGVGHLPMEEAPDIVADEIRAFLVERGVAITGPR
ncbi:MAG: alpha/beta hydrolase, partial [Amphiplicatus sp.]